MRKACGHLTQMCQVVSSQSRSAAAHRTTGNGCCEIRTAIARAPTGTGHRPANHYPNLSGNGEAKKTTATCPRNAAPTSGAGGLGGDRGHASLGEAKTPILRFNSRRFQTLVIQRRSCLALTVARHSICRRLADAGLRPADRGQIGVIPDGAGVCGRDVECPVAVDYCAFVGGDCALGGVNGSRAWASIRRQSTRSM